MQFVGFTLGEDFFGAAIPMVQEIIRTAPVISLPNAPDFVDGVIHLRTSIIPHINMRKRLDINHTHTETGKSRFLVLDIHGTTASIMVDSVTGIHNAEYPHIETDASPTGLAGNRYVKGISSVGELQMKILDFDRILDSGKRSQLGSIGNGHERTI